MAKKKRHIVREVIPEKDSEGVRVFGKIAALMHHFTNKDCVMNLIINYNE